MILKRTKEGSQFLCFNLDSNTGGRIFNYNTPEIRNKKIEVLQVAYINGNEYDVIIEFKYLED